MCSKMLKETNYDASDHITWDLLAPQCGQDSA